MAAKPEMNSHPPSTDATALETLKSCPRTLVFEPTKNLTTLHRTEWKWKTSVSIAGYASWNLFKVECCWTFSKWLRYVNSILDKTVLAYNRAAFYRNKINSGSTFVQILSFCGTKYVMDMSTFNYSGIFIVLNINPFTITFLFVLKKYMW